MDATIHIPRAAEEIIGKLNKHGFEAYVVGGCVRDALLGREPEDWDITTSAKPEQVKAIFGRTIDTGIKHGTVTILRGRTGYEVTTYRIDGEYEDGRHPKSVEFTPDLVEDLKRRDFTMNAMAYNGEDGLVDVFGGQQDMKARLIRCVGRAEDRFTEDALRILRALRFAAQLDFEIETETEAALRKLAPNLVHVSKERIQTELTKLLLSEHPNRMRRVFDCGAAAYVSDTFAKLEPEKIAVSPRLPARKSLRWAALLRHQSAEDAKRILRELKLDNDTIASVGTLVEWWRQPLGQTQADIRRVMSRMSPELFDDLLCLKTEILRYYKSYSAAGENKCITGSPERNMNADDSYELPPCAEKIGGIAGGGVYGVNADESHELRRYKEKMEDGEDGLACGIKPDGEIPDYDRIPETPEQLADILAASAGIRARGDCISLKTLAVTGGDLLAAGMKPGREIGAALERLLEMVLEYPERNTKEELMRYVTGPADK